MSTVDPTLEVVEFYPFGIPDNLEIDYAFHPMFGCMIVKGAYPGALKDRPIWADVLQEIICVSVQILITCFVLIKSISFVSKRHPKIFPSMFAAS
jgi:hypothetical protein